MFRSDKAQRGSLRNIGQALCGEKQRQECDAAKRYTSIKKLLHEQRLTQQERTSYSPSSAASEVSIALMTLSLIVWRQEIT